jgi:hypothetical protein
MSPPSSAESCYGKQHRCRCLTHYSRHMRPYYLGVNSSRHSAMQDVQYTQMPNTVSHCYQTHYVKYWVKYCDKY